MLCTTVEEAFDTVENVFTDDGDQIDIVIIPPSNPADPNAALILRISMMTSWKRTMQCKK